jgi:hypothetical protein
MSTSTLRRPMALASHHPDRLQDFRGREPRGELTHPPLDGGGLVADGLACERHEPGLAGVELRRAQVREHLVDLLHRESLGREQAARFRL